MKFKIYNTGGYDFSLDEKYYNDKRLKKYNLKKDPWKYDGVIVKNSYTIEINSLEELMKFVKDVGCEIIINYDDDLGNTIEIYDDYRE